MTIELTSEQAHHLGGAAALLIALCLLLAETAVIRGAWPRWLIPAALVIWGIRSITHPLPRGAEASAAHEGSQHILIGAAVLLVGIVEALRAAGKLRAAFWSLVMPAGLLVVGGLFYFHAQHDAGVSVETLVIQHRIIGVTLAISAIARFLADRDHARLSGFRIAWPVTVLLFGLELMLYVETVMGHAH